MQQLKEAAIEASRNPRKVYGYAHYGQYEVGPEEPVEGDSWVTLDRVTHGLHRNKFVYLAARQKVGKTRFLAGILPNLAEQVPEGQVIRVFTFETTTAMWLQTSAATIAGIANPTYIDTGELTPEQLAKYLEALDYLDTLPILYYQKPIPFDKLRYLVEARKEGSRKTFVWVLDHIGLVSDSGIGEEGSSGLRGLSRNISYLCHDTATGIIVGHLNRASVGEEPTLASLAGSDNIGRDVDEAFFLYRVWDGRERPEGLLDDGEPVLLKVESRHYAGRSMWIWWDKRMGQFRELSEDEQDNLSQFKPPKKPTKR